MNDNIGIINTIKLIVKDSIKKIAYDKTYRGYVTSVDNGVYSIQINGKIYNTIRNPSGYNISNGDIVYVCFPQNNMSQGYICSGRIVSSVRSGVTSVNGKTGYVELTANDVGALPNTTTIPSKTSDLVNNSGFITSANLPTKVSELDNDVGFITEVNIPVKSVNGQTGDVDLDKSNIGLNNVDNIKQYSVSNPPPYPVTSVNGKIGDVVIDVGNAIVPSDDKPLINKNVANPGTSTKYARGDHIHPTDTSRLAQIGGEATNLKVIDAVDIVNQNGDLVNILQSSGNIKLVSVVNKSESDVLITGVAEPQHDNDAVNLSYVNTNLEIINQIASDALDVAQQAQSDVNNKAPKSHASTSTTYGVGNASSYGHVKLSNSFTSTLNATSGTAATPYAVKTAYDRADIAVENADAALNMSNNIINTYLNGKQIQCGWSNISFKNTSQTDTRIEFDNKFADEKPVVLIGQPFNGVICTVFQDAVDASGFTVNVPKVGSATVSTRQMAWVAIGRI